MIAARILAIVGFFALLQPTAYAQNVGLDALLQKVRSDRQIESAQFQERERAFLAEKSQQEALVRQAKAELRTLQGQGQVLRAAFSANEKTLAGLEQRLTITMGTMGELFGVVRQVAADTRSQFENSIITAQFPDRLGVVDEIANRKKLATITELEQLWYELQREMNESAKVSHFKSEIVKANGTLAAEQIARVGSFNLVATGRFLAYYGDTNQVVELARQPARRFRSMATNLVQAKPGEMVAFPVDPSRGSILSLLVQAPSLRERIEQGGLVGYVILSILAFGLILVGERLIRLRRLARSIEAQLSSEEIDLKNPLGQILAAYHKLSDCKDPDALELRMHEAVLKATPPIERGVGFLKLLAAIAPLLGLLGTVTGMIATFQAITLFGTGDPKLMAGGISQALITTVLGLVAAIPLLLLHSLVASRSKGLVQILEEQSAGLVAERVEQEALS